MTIEDYNLGELRDRVLEEFGLDKNDPDTRRIADKKINDAQVKVAALKRDWPWRLGELAIDISPSVSIKGDVTKGSRFIRNVDNPSSDHLRFIVADSVASAQATSGHLITEVNSPDYTLQTQWLGEDAIQADLTLLVGFVETPVDFSRIKTLDGIGTISDIDFVYKTSLMFEKIKRERNLVGISRIFYTVKNDPLGVSPRKYLAFYPFLSTRISIVGDYYRVIPKLENNGDIPIIPHDDRGTLLDCAYWGMAVSQRLPQEDIVNYREQYLGSVREMISSYGYSEDPEGLPEDEGAEPDFVQFPPGYPDIRELS